METIDNPVEKKDKSSSGPDDGIDQLLEDMGKIKHLLFCRLLLSHATLLPAAIKANSVDEFLNDKDIAYAYLRGIALKLDNPGLQDIHDACADPARGERAEDEDLEDSEDDKNQ